MWLNRYTRKPRARNSNLSHNDNFFGARLRRLIAAKGLTIVDFAREYGISEAQLHNWLKQESPPLAKHWPKLAEFFGVPRETIAFGNPENLEPREAVEESQAPYLPSGAGGLSDRALAITEQIQAAICAVVTAANGDPVRLGWIYEQIDQHVRPPATWPKVMPPVEPAAPRTVHPAPVRTPQRQAAAG